MGMRHIYLQNLDTDFQTKNVAEYFPKSKRSTTFFITVLHFLYHANWPFPYCGRCHRVRRNKHISRL